MLFCGGVWGCGHEEGGGSGLPLRILRGQAVLQPALNLTSGHDKASGLKSGLTTTPFRMKESDY